MSELDLDAIQALGQLAREDTFRPGWPYQGSGEWTDNVVGMLGGHTGNFAGAMSPDVVDALIARIRELEVKNTTLGVERARLHDAFDRVALLARDLSASGDPIAREVAGDLIARVTTNPQPSGGVA